MGRTLVIGIGREQRGDDAAGRLVLRALVDRVPPGVELVEEEGEAMALMERMEGFDTVHMIDACRSGAAPGKILRLEVSAAPLPELRFQVSTHGMGLVEAIELARALGRLPRRCILHAIEGQCFDFGAPVSPAVAAAIGELAQRLAAELAAAGRGGDGDARSRSGS